MDETHATPTKQFSLSRWLLGILLSVSMVIGGVIAVGALFFADGLFKPGEDPAIPAAEIQQVNARVKTLEDRVAQLPQEQSQAVPSEELQNNVSALQKRIDDLSVQAHESKAGQVVLALTQIKDAYANDMPMRPGIELLQKSVTDTDVLKKLDELQALTTDQFPTKASLIADAQALMAPAPKAFNVDQGPSADSWGGRLKNVLGQFISVTPNSVEAESTTSSNLVQALSRDDLPVANSLINQLPVSPALKDLAFKIQTRLRAQQLIQQVISTVTQMANTNGEGLY